MGGKGGMVKSSSGGVERSCSVSFIWMSCLYKGGGVVLCIMLVWLIW